MAKDNGMGEPKFAVPSLESTQVSIHETRLGTLLGIVLTFECGCRVHCFSDPHDILAAMDDMVTMFSLVCLRGDHETTHLPPANDSAKT